MISSEFLEPFLISFRDHPDYDASDVLNEINSMLICNIAAEDYLEGTASEDYFFDLLAEQGIEPNLYVDAVTDNIDYLLAHPHLLYC